MKRLLPAPVRRPLAVAKRALVDLRHGRRLPARLIPARWERRLAPPFPLKICLFVMLARDGRLLPHSVDHARAWAEAGYAVVAVVVTDRIRDGVDLDPLTFASAILTRANGGHDFGAWAAAIQRLGPVLRGCDTLALTNDSLLGPSADFAAMIGRAEAMAADVVGLTESREIEPHLQSYVVLFRRYALRSRAFRRFWGGVRNYDRDRVILRYEVALQSHFAAAGFSTAAVFGNADAGGVNPTLFAWRTLLADGFPFIKVMLLRDNPFRLDLGDWLAEAERHGFDRQRLALQVAELKRSDGRTWAAA